MKKGKEAIKENLKSFSPLKITLLIGELMATAGAACKNGMFRDPCPSIAPLLNEIMKELRDGNNSTIGVLGPDSCQNASLVETVRRRVESSEGLFDAVVMASASNNPNYRKIQDEIGEALDLSFDAPNRSRRWLPKVFGSRNDNLNDEIESRARRLRPRMLAEDRILVILRDVCSNGLDFDKVGIPCGIYHTGCKLLLTSSSEDVLSNMHAHRIFTL